jgi:hypothetical protein
MVFFKTAKYMKKKRKILINYLFVELNSENVYCEKRKNISDDDALSFFVCRS